MSDKQVFGLVCAGGGAHGAYQVGVLKYIHEHFTIGECSPFQIFTGTSCGALNTSFYAAQSYDARQSRLWLEDLWLHFHVPAYHANLFKIAIASLFKKGGLKPLKQRSSWSLLDPSPMQKVIRKGFKRNNLEKSFQKETTLGLGIATTELLTGRSVWFVEGKAASEWNLFHSMGVRDTIAMPHVAASCSVPIFLPPVKIGERYYLDGSISLDRPLSAAISMGATRILNISTQKRQPPELPSYRPHFKPRITHVIRMLLNRLTYDAASDEAAQIETLNRFYEALRWKEKRRHTHVEHIPLFHEEALPAHYQPIEVYLFEPSKRIDYLSVITEANSWRNPRRTTRFMFHEKFIRKLIQWGYHDAASKHDELENFFHPEAKPKWWQFFYRKSA